MESVADFSSNVPVYQQIVDYVEKQLAVGSLKPGDRLPAERSLAEQFSVARGTVKHAYLELERRGILEIRPGSGAYVCNDRQSQLVSRLEQLLCNLRQQGLSKWEVEMLARETAWSGLSDEERIRVAWVDCSPELFSSLTGQLESACNVSVSPCLLDDLVESPLLLAEREFDFIATSINHFDELEPLSKVPEYGSVAFERLVMSLSRPVVSVIAGIKSSDAIAVFYDSAMYRRSVEMFLAEFGAKANYSYFPMRYGLERFSNYLSHWNLVIVPPDPAYMGGLPAEIEALCRKGGIRTLRFENLIDYGSLQFLKERAQSRWLERSEMPGGGEPSSR